MSKSYLDPIHSNELVWADFTQNRSRTMLRTITKHIKREDNFITAKQLSDMGTLIINRSFRPVPMNSVNAAYAYRPTAAPSMQGIHELTGISTIKLLHGNDASIQGVRLALNFLYRGEKIQYKKQVPQRMKTMVDTVRDTYLETTNQHALLLLLGYKAKVLENRTIGYSPVTSGYGFHITIDKQTGDEYMEAGEAFLRNSMRVFNQKCRLLVEQLRLHLDPYSGLPQMKIKSKEIGE